jgi:FAD/FMN-containing dehydrogenase
LHNGKQFNLSKLLAGSEGTLAFTTEMKINLVEHPPKNVAVIAAHFNSLRQALQANIIAMNHKPGAVELIDNNILELTKEISHKNAIVFSSKAIRSDTCN